MNSASTLLRSIFRAPMSLGDVYTSAIRKYPQFMNYYSVVGVLTFATILGHGAEKFTLKGHMNQKSVKAEFEKQQALVDA